MKKFEEKTIARTQIYDGKIISLHKDEVQLPNGETAQRELVKHPGGVAVIPITKDKKILFVEQYRKPLERTLIEIPAGKIESHEKPEVTAIRELEEETGYTTDELTYVTSFYTSPGFADEIIHIYMTDQLEQMEEAIAGDEDEFVEVVELTLEQAQEAINNQQICDAKTNYAILYLQKLERF